MTNRVMRFKNNPNARGFIVYVLEEISRDDSPEALAINGGLPILKFEVIATKAAGTKKKADAVYSEMKAEYNAR